MIKDDEIYLDSLTDDINDLPDQIQDIEDHINNHSFISSKPLSTYDIQKIMLAHNNMIRVLLVNSGALK